MSGWVLEQMCQGSTERERERGRERERESKLPVIFYAGLSSMVPTVLVSRSLRPYEKKKRRFLIRREKKKKL